jgi:phosphoribulokinase
MAGRTVQVRHYNHETGIYDKGANLKSNDFLIFSGLHTLKLPTLPAMLDLSIYLEMDEDLRRALKIDRDVNVRGHSLEKVESSLARREPDVKKFIAPQKDTADLVFRIESLPSEDDKGFVNAEFVITVTSNLGMDFQEMRRVLVSLAQVDFIENDSDFADRPSVTISGNLSSLEIEAAVSVLAPRVLEFCASKPIWNDGALGIMQVVFFAQLEHVLVKRTFR